MPRVRSRKQAFAEVHVAMLGARMHYAVPRLLHEAGLLGRFYTDSYAGNKPALAAWLGRLPRRVQPNGLRRWAGRAADGLPGEKVVSFEAFGLRYALARRRARDGAAITGVYARFGREFGRRVIRHLERAGAAPTVVWGFNGAALELFEWAKARGARCVLEQTIAPRAVQHELLAREIARWPGWQPGLELPPGGDALVGRERPEWALADVIVCGSGFVADGLRAQGVAADKLRVVPYGVDVRRFGGRAPPRAFAPPLRVLFAGEVGVRKGAPYLLEALRALGPQRVSARFAGRVALAPDRLRPYAEVAEFLGVVPRAEMAALYAWADVFCLPSVCEGSATVTYEALMAGVPVVTTPNAGSVVEDGASGRIVPVGDAPALARALQGYLAEPALLARHAAGALALRDAVGLARYRDDLAALIAALAAPQAVPARQEYAAT